MTALSHSQGKSQTHFILTGKLHLGYLPELAFLRSLRPAFPNGWAFDTAI
jgi:hypothetical protein